MAERLAASLLPAASPSPSARRATVGAAAAASFPCSCPARAGLRLRSSSRRPARFSKAAGRGGALRVVRCMAASDAAQLKGAREDIRELLKTTYCHPIMVNRKRSRSFFLL